MALNEEWENLAENYDTFERKARWAQLGDQMGVGSFVAMIAALVTAILPIYLLLGVVSSFREDKWLQAFGLMFLLGLTIVCFKWLLMLTTYSLAFVLVLGVMWGVGSCMYSAVSDKIDRETGKTAAPASVEDEEESDSAADPEYKDPVEQLLPGFKRIPCTNSFGEKTFCLVKE